MSLTLITSIVICLLSMGVTIVLARRLRNWKVGFLTVVLGLITIRQIVTVLEIKFSWATSFATQQVELDGLVVSILASFTVVFLKIVVDQEIKSRETLKQANAELQETKRYLASLIENSTDAVISTDKEGKVVLFNSGAEALLGYRREEIIGRRGTVLYNSEEFAEGVMRLMRQSGGKFSSFETLLRTKDGTLVPVLLSASILCDENGQETGTVRFAHDLRERKEIEKELENLAVTDALTGLYNRACFAAKLEEEFQRAVRYGTPFSLIIIDIDNFKSVNDTYGHPGGDTYLKAFARLMVRSVRQLDVVARYGGEEIAILLPHTEPDVALVVAERLRATVEAFDVSYGRHSIRCTVSAGVVSYNSRSHMAVEDALKAADNALYAAKNGGRNRVISSQEGLGSICVDQRTPYASER